MRRKVKMANCQVKFVLIFGGFERSFPQIRCFIAEMRESIVSSISEAHFYSG